MKNNRPANHFSCLSHARRWGGVVLLSASIALSPLPLMAQEPAAGQATLNFVGADIESVIKAVGHYVGRTFIIDPRVKGTISLVSEKSVSKTQAFNLLTSALRLQGYAVVTVDGYTKVVPEPDAKLQAGPIQVGELRGDQVATRIFRLNYESSGNLVAVLRPLISPNNTITANPGNNSLIITDYADNLQRMEKIIAALDAPATGVYVTVAPAPVIVTRPDAGCVTAVIVSGSRSGSESLANTSISALCPAVIVAVSAAARGAPLMTTDTVAVLRPPRRSVSV